VLYSSSNGRKITVDPVVTWAGQGADIPRINAACARLGLQEPAAEITRRHSDAYLWAFNNVRLPTLSLGLKEVSRYFGFRPATDVRDGLDAVTLYIDWLSTGDESIKTRLIDYNHDDLNAVALIADRLTDLSPAATVTHFR
jgi:predicted RecB family nuclease